MRMVSLALALIAVVAACGRPAAPQAHGASPPPLISPVAVPSPGPTPATGPLPLSTVNFSCQLAVFVDRGQGPAGAFIDFPSGTVTPDPGAAKGRDRKRHPP